MALLGWEGRGTVVPSYKKESTFKPTPTRSNQSLLGEYLGTRGYNTMPNPYTGIFQKTSTTGKYGEFINPYTGEDMRGYSQNSGGGYGYGMYEMPDFDFPSMPYVDPLEQAKQWAEYQRQMRVAEVNRMIDAQVHTLEQERGRVPEYYQKLYGQLGTNREAALSGSEASMQGINRAYTQDRLSLADTRDKMMSDAQTFLLSKGVLNSGRADRVYNDINSMISRNITDIMKEKDIKIADILEGKESVQEAFTTALTNAQKEEQEYLKNIEGEITYAEKQRGTETFNISEELNRYTPILARELQNDMYNMQMQNAIQKFNAQLAMAQYSGLGSGGGGYSMSPLDQARMAQIYAGIDIDKARLLMDQAGMNNNTPNMQGMIDFAGAYGTNPNIANIFPQSATSSYFNMSPTDTNTFLRNLQNVYNQQNQAQPTWGERWMGGWSNLLNGFGANVPYSFGLYGNR